MFTLAVQLVGVYLVFASLIMPALATKRLYAAFLIGAAGYFIGLWISTLLDLPAGTTIVCTLATLSGMVGSFLKKDP